MTALRTYCRLTEFEREEISRSLACGQSYQKIAHQLNRAVSTISREVCRGRSTRLSYRAGPAHRRAKRHARRRRLGKRKLIANARLRVYVTSRLRLRWSPEQIAETLKKEYPCDRSMRISHEAIYMYIYILPKGTLRTELIKCFRRHRKRRFRRRNNIPSSRPLKDMVSIEERPPDVAGRMVPGHWEGDLMIGRNRQSALGTLVERTSRFGLLVRLHGKDAEEIRRRFAAKLRRLPQHARLTLTYDQGREMAGHVALARDTEMHVYFAHKGCPWERATNENYNGLVRQFFPKGTDFNKVSAYQISRVQHLINGRPRKVLDWETPYKIFAKVFALET